MTGKKRLSDAEWQTHLQKYTDGVIKPAVDDLKDSVSEGPPFFEILDGGLGLKQPSSDNALIAIPVIRHWLFAPDRTKARTRRFSVTVKHQGQRLVQDFQVGDPHAALDKGYGVLTARHQKALLALQEIWQCQGGRMANVNGRRQGLVSASSRELEIKLFGRPGGRQSIMVRQAIQELASIPVSIKNYIGPANDVRDIDMTGLISGAFFNDKPSSQGSVKRLPWVEILLGDIVTRAFEQQAVKPLNLMVMRGLSGDLATLLYPKLDYLLFANSSVSFALMTLVRNLGLHGEIERKPSRRRRLFETVARELNGKPLSSRGRILHTRIDYGASTDGDDFLTATR